MQINREIKKMTEMKMKKLEERKRTCKLKVEEALMADVKWKIDRKRIRR